MQLINDFKNIFVFTAFICNSLLPNTIVGLLVLIFTVKLYGFNKNLTSFKI